MNPKPTPQLEALAHAYGIHTSYTDVEGRRHRASADSLIAVLRVLGATLRSSQDAPGSLEALRADRWATPLPPVAAVRTGEFFDISLNLPERRRNDLLQLIFELEDGRVWSRDVHAADLPVRESGSVRGESFVRLGYSAPSPLPTGYHTLRLEGHGTPSACLIVSAPQEAYPAERRTWGSFVPAYSLHSEQSWGCGDLGDLRTFGAWTRSLGAGFVATLPLTAAFLDEPFDPSPYAPVSRLFWNELFLDVAAIPELETSSAAADMLASAQFLRELDELRAGSYVDYRRTAALKSGVLEKLAASFFTDPHPRRLEAFRRFIAEHPAVEEYAQFRAVADRYRSPWQEWPDPARSGNPRAGDFEQASRLYHLFVQWQLTEQLSSLAASQNLYLDLPLGVHPGGFDTWKHRELFSFGASLGAPPDTFFNEGQNWGFPPPAPEASRAAGHAYLRACLQAQLPYARYLRLDHIMSVHRLFWIPRGAEPRDGVYVSYPADELYAVLALESQRHGTTIVGEDLGTVPPEVRPGMTDHGIRRLFVLQYELGPEDTPELPPVPERAVASLNTHDMPPFAAFLEERGCPPGEIQRRLAAALAHLAGGNAEVLQVNLEDLWLETEPQNVPATGPDQPNWRRRTAYPLEELMRLSDVQSSLEKIDSERRGVTSPMPPPEKPQNARVTDQDIYLFNEGSHLDLADKLGAHLGHEDGTEGAYFSVWAPSAEKVSVIGDFNDWDKEAHPLHPYGSSGIWEGFAAGATRGDTYKYRIVSEGGSYQVDKADPVGIHHETPPRTGSKIWSLEYEWNDEEWMAARAQRSSLDAPISVYEVHIGSWARDNDRLLTYRELAPRLADHVSDLGFTHVEFLPVMEHPFYGSWGYQVTGYFAPTSRYGTPQDFMYLVDYLHQREIGVILDWVPSHFPNDEHGLVRFDGTHLYEHADPRLGFHPDWDSMIFNYGRHEVRSFLLSSALFWIGRYHIDGLRVDAVASMLYRDYSREGGDWIPNEYGGRENLEAITLLRRLNEEMYRRHPDVQTIAEESTAWPMVSRPTYVGGLGFGLKWDMGWMHDTLDYMSRDPIHRRYHHDRLTFRAMYAFTENFMLPLSHDEVVHGKGSLLNKMPGDEWRKFANLRILLTYLFTEPGKKLLFMGDEIGQWREWDHDSALDWHLLEKPAHAGIEQLVRRLNSIYREEPALHELDTEPEGFEWVSADDSENSVIAFIRKGRSTDDIALVAFNFTPIPRYNYQVGVPRGGAWSEILSSDAAEYGGSGHGNLGSVDAAPLTCHGRSHCLNLTLPPLGAVVLRSRGS